MSAASFDVSDAPAVSGAHRTRGRTPEPAPYRDEDFPGCESFHLPAGELESYEGRLEFWDGATETAWKGGSWATPPAPLSSQPQRVPHPFLPAGECE